MSERAPLLLHVFPTFRVGGSQARFATIANHFAGRYRHAIAAMNGGYDCFNRLSADVEAERWDVPAPKRNTIRNVMTFRRLLRTKKPDLLVTYNWGAIEWALANRPGAVPHIHIEDGFGPEEAHGQLIRRVLMRRLALANSTVVLPSRTLCQLAFDCWRLAPQRVHYVPNGIDVPRFAARRDPVRLPPREGLVIGTVAALRTEKNIPRLLRAFRAVREKYPSRLVIAGNGPKRGELERLAAQILPPDSYVFLGHVEAVERVYAALDVFALSSDTEQMPTSLMEAMAAGLPVLATDVGDVREMVAPENRPFVVPREDRLFFEGLLRLVAAGDSRKSIGASNAARARAHFGIDRMFREYDARFETELARSADRVGHSCQ